MRRVLGFVAGILVGQWLVFGSVVSPADLHARASAAWKHGDYPEALRLLSQAVSLQPGNAELQYLRGRALAALGLRASAADAFHVTVLLEPQSTLAREALDGLASLHRRAGDGEVIVPLEPGVGVWIVPVIVNGHRGRFLLDTGASVVVVGPALAAAAHVKPVVGRDAIELQTLGGRTHGTSAVVASLEVGNALLHDVPVVLHEPSPGVDGILGNTVLSRYKVTIDADRRQLALRLPGAGE